MHVIIMIEGASIFFSKFTDFTHSDKINYDIE